MRETWRERWKEGKRTEFLISDGTPSTSFHLSVHLSPSMTKA